MIDAFLSMRKKLTPRERVVAGSELLWSFLSRFGLHDLSEVGSGRGTWRIEQDEDGPDLELAPDLGPYLEILADIAKNALIPEYYFPCWVCESRRRVHLCISYDDEKDEWYYEYPGARDDAGDEDDHPEPHPFPPLPPPEP